jgi:hypothetical protein
MKPVVVKRINLDHVLAHDKTLFNTNNHWVIEKIPKPDDYEESLDRGKTRNWIDLFHKDDYHKITLDESDLKWLNEAFKIGTQTNRFSHIYDDELEELCKKYGDMIPDGNYFIRTDRVSLKNGIHGTGPYSNFRKIIESMVTSSLGHECFMPDDKSCPIYFMKWQDITPDKEFRIFVYQNEITAISAQHLYSINEWLNTLTDEQINEKVNKIITFFNENIREKMMYMGNYVMDLALIGEDETPYFIEPNSFDRYYAAGSALYHWVYDHDTLHESDVIELRYVNEY